MRPPVPVSISRHRQSQAIFGTRERISLSEPTAKSMMKFDRLSARKRKAFIRIFLIQLGFKLPSNPQTMQMLVKHHERNGKKLTIVHITVTDPGEGFFPRLTQYGFLLEKIPGNTREFNRYKLPNDHVYGEQQGSKSQRLEDKRKRETLESRGRKPRACPGGCGAQYTRGSERETLKRPHTRANPYIRQMCVWTLKTFKTGDTMLEKICCATLLAPEGRNELYQHEDRADDNAAARDESDEFLDSNSKFT